jgi:O-antigen/teichoic acid export membrane protein
MRLGYPPGSGGRPGAPARLRPGTAGPDVLLQIAGRAVNLALGVLVTVVIVRTLGDRGFGQWITVFTIVQIAEHFADFGLTGVTVRRAAAEPGRETEWVGAHAGLRLLTGFPVAAACVPLILLISDSEDMRTAGLILSAVLLVGAPNALRVVFQLRVRNDVNVKLMVLNSAVWAAAVGAIALADGGMVALAIAFVGTVALVAALQAVLALRAMRVPFRGSSRLWPAIARAAAPLGAAAVLTLAYARIDQALVFALAGYRDAGLYGAVYRILDSAQLVPQSLMTTLLPIIAAGWAAEPDRVRGLLQRAGDYLAMASLPALAFAIAAAEPLVTFLFGDEFADAAPALAVLMGAYVLISFGYLAGHMVIVLELQGRLMRIAAAALILNVALNVALVPDYGFMAAAWATLATEAFVLTLSMRMVLGAAAIRPRLARVARICAAAAGMALAVWALREADAPLGALVAAAVVVYPALLFTLRALTACELRTALSSS